LQWQRPGFDPSGATQTLPYRSLPDTKATLARAGQGTEGKNQSLECSSSISSLDEDADADLSSTAPLLLLCTSLLPTKTEEECWCAGAAAICMNSMEVTQGLSARRQFGFSVDVRFSKCRQLQVKFLSIFLLLC
jgi:hypothetical protein